MSLEGGEPLSAWVHISEVPSLLEAAVNYARDGKPVFPCNPFDKAPLVGCDRDADGNKIEKTGGYYKATTDENQIRIWWTKWPNAMIGIRMGFTSGIWAIDPDVPDTLDDPDGLQNWDELQEVHGLAPPTRAHRTPSGGLHLLFKWRADKPVTTAEGRLSGLGINVRGEGGYIIAPPSINTNTVPYEVFDASEISEAPDWLYDLILGEEKVEETPEFKAASLSSGALRRYGDAALRNEVDKLSQTTTCRNIALNKAAFSLGQLVAIDALTRDRVAGELYHACERNGLTTDRKNSSPRRVRRTIQSGLDAGEKKPRIIPERPERHEAHQQQQGPAGGWPFQSAKDFRTDFNRNWIIKGVLAPGEVSTWCAPPKKGKSAVLGDLSLHVVAEALQEWRSYRCKKKGAVVYFALERADLVKRRFNAQAAQYGIDPKPLPFHVVGITIEMMSPGCVKAFLDTIKATEEACGIPVIVIVIDTSAKAIAAGGGEENSAKDKNILRANARRVIDALPDLHVAFVSHTGKDEEKGERGSNASLGDDDMRVMLDGQLAKVDARNDGPEGPLTNYQIIPVVVGKDEDGEEITIGIVDPDTSKKAPPKNKPKGQPGLALDYLVEAINEVGQPPPTWLGLPPSVPRAVTVEQWKEQCQRRRLGGDEEDSRRRAFDRALDKLKELRLAETLDGYAWILYE